MRDFVAHPAKHPHVRALRGPRVTRERGKMSSATCIPRHQVHGFSNDTGLLYLRVAHPDPASLVF